MVTQSKKYFTKDIKLSDIPIHIIQNALSKNDFYCFKNIMRYFPHVESVKEFIKAKEYLGGLAITFGSEADTISDLSNEIYLKALTGMLEQIESEIKNNVAEYEGTKNFKPHNIDIIFDDKVLNIDKDDERANGDEDFVFDKTWYAFNANYGTSEEKAFVRMLAGQMEGLEKQYKNIYLIRNERHFKIFSFSGGRAFEPDFVLFLKEKNGQLLTYQLFIEPKGKHLKRNEEEKWKEDFLKEIKEEFKNKILTFTSKDKYRIIGVPFYNNEEENIFKASLNDALDAVASA